MNKTDKKEIKSIFLEGIDRVVMPVLNDILVEQKSMKVILNEHTNILNDHSNRLDNIEKKLDATIKRVDKHDLILNSN